MTSFIYFVCWWWSWGVYIVCWTNWTACWIGCWTSCKFQVNPQVLWGEVLIEVIQSAERSTDFVLDWFWRAWRNSDRFRLLHQSSWVCTWARAHGFVFFWAELLEDISKSEVFYLNFAVIFVFAGFGVIVSHKFVAEWVWIRLILETIDKRRECALPKDN